MNEGSADIRNFAVVGHASSGKTMLCESMLVCCGVQHRLGSIAQGTTRSDYHESERQRQISVHASLLHVERLGKKLNILDTPGYLDFISEALGALRVVDFAVVVVQVTDGIGVGTEQVWAYATQYGIPKVLVINALDKEHSDFDKTLAHVKARFGDRVFPMSLPVNPGPGFNQVLDVLRSEMVTYKTDGSGAFEETPATGAWAEKVKQLHTELVEHVAESDDTLLEKFFEQGGLSEEEMRGGIHAAVQNQSIIPLFCTSAETNVGVARLLDFVAKYGASPLDRSKIKAIDADDAEVEIPVTKPDPVLYVFKTMTEAQFGELSFFRVYAGSIAPGTDLYNTNRKSSERFGQIYILNGRDRSTANVLQAGDIGAVAKLKNTHTGDTLCGGKTSVTLPKVVYPQPNIHAGLKVNARGEEDKVAAGLSALHDEDPTFLFHVDSELRQTVISAQGALHLEVIIDRLKRRYNVDIELVPLKIAFRETILKPSDSKYRHKKQTGGAGQFAEVWMRIEPKARGEGVEFTQSLTGQNVDRVFVPSVEKGVMNACQEGILAGYRVTDVKIDFYDGKMHPVDSKDIAFQIAGYFAFKEAFEKAAPRLLEPINTVEVKIPEEFMGKVISDLSSRRGKISGMDSDGTFQLIRAQVPAQDMYQYSTTLRSLTGGRGMHSESFSHYAEMPMELQQKVIEEYKKRREKES